jgi:pseudaminic acid cytidylyltransferase
MKTSGRICIIPARGGSKRIPRKNIRLFAGKPIIAYPIQAALDSGCFDEVMVSTDDWEIASVARAHGAQVPFLRSPKTSDDHSGTLEVINEVIETYRRSEQREFEYGCCLFATAALVTPERLREGWDIISSQPNLNYVLTLIPFGFPIQRAVYMLNGRVHMFHPEHYTTRSQDLPKSYKDAGQWHWFRSGCIGQMLPVLGPTSGAVILSEAEAQDIDDEEDWRLAELKHQAKLVFHVR